MPQTSHVWGREWWLFAGAVFGALFWIRYTFQQIAEIAVQCLTDQIKMLEVDPWREVVVILVDRGWPDSCCACQIRLCPPSFAKSGRQ